MEEFIFGTVAVDELKLMRHRVARSGLQHDAAIEPLDPEPDQPVKLIVWLSNHLPADQVVCYYTLDGSEPLGIRGNAENGQVIQLRQVDAIWDTFLWQYIAVWAGVLPGQPEGTLVRYRIGAWRNEGPEAFADWPETKATSDRAAAAFFHGQPLQVEWVGDPSKGTTFAYCVDRWTPPSWAAEAVFYQIFVDRFFPGEGRAWIQTENLRKFFGGTLWGVAEKMDYIADLGATGIWLSPIFPSPSTHGYDATDYFSVEPRLGGQEALRALVQSAHERGIRIILDLVCNHLSSEHPIFRDAQKNPRSRYRDWFFFDEPQLDYRTFFGVQSMPELNLANPQARQWMLEIARYWLREFDIDGYRLDHANGPGPSFWSEFRQACREEKADCFAFGEIVEPADVLRRYTGRLDGVLDFLLADALRRTYGFESWLEESLALFLRDHHRFFDPRMLLLTFIDNHDMDRFLFIAGGDKRRLLRAVRVQMQLPGAPVIYYGTEVGLSQKVSKTSETGLEASRMAMIWDKRQDHALLEEFQQLIRWRKRTRPWTKSSLDLDLHHQVSEE